MKKYLIASMLLFVIYLNGQEKLAAIKAENNFVLGTNLSLGRILIPSNGIGLNFGLEFKNKNLFGFGLHFSSGSYDALDFNANPSVADITNYDPETDAPFRGLSYVDGSTRDRLMINTVYFSKGYKLNKHTIVDIQVGPSLNIFRRQKFTYRYNPPFGSFSGSSPPRFFAKSSESKRSIIGFNIRGCIYYRLSTNTVISLVPFINFNKETHVFGLQLGFVFGKKYKRKLFLD